MAFVHRLLPRLSGRRRLNQDFRDMRMDRIAVDGSMLMQWVFSRRLNGHTALPEQFGMRPMFMLASQF